MGHTADVAGDGIEAIRLLTQNHYGLVLMDCQMPLMDGYTATRIIRKSPAVKNPNVPILALTADNDEITLTNCKSVGMNDCLAKPISRNVLEQILLEISSTR